MSIALSLSINSKEGIEITLSNKGEDRSELSWDYAEEIHWKTDFASHTKPTEETTQGSTSFIWDSMEYLEF